MSRPRSSETSASPPSGRAEQGGPATAIGSVFWLEQALADADEARCEPLAGTVQADVCIVGGGYTGLWTALELRASAPDVSVVVLEASACGLGASGRNGGWVTSWVDEIDALVEKFGAAAGRWLAEESSATIGRIRDFTGEHGIDCQLRQEGTLWAAGTEEQLGAIRSVAAAAREHGFGRLFEDLSQEELARRTGTRATLGGVLVRDSASVQPALLVRGLRRKALERGVRIFEGSPLIRLERERTATAITPAGRVQADQVVLATNAWAAQVRELRRALVLVGSHIVLTEPIPERVAGLEWSRGALLGDARLFVHYSQITPGGRIAFGRGGGTIGPLGRVVPKHFYDPATVRAVAADFYDWFPQLRDVRLTHAWGGAVDRAPGHLPFVGTLGDHENVHYGVGYSGNGVGPSALVGRILARRALQLDDEYARCALVSGPPGYLPPEPLRTVGGMLVRQAVLRSEEREAAGRPAGRVGRAAKRLVSFSTPR